MYADYPDGTNEQFSYDPVGNRESYQRTAAEVHAETLVYNNANQLIRRGDHYYHYDANGHRISEGSDPAGIDVERRYRYDSRERLIQVEDGAGHILARYGYNPFGHRLWKAVGGVVTYFLYSPSGLVGEYAADGRLLAEYHYLPDSPWMTQPLFQRRGGEVYLYQTDHLGTPQRMVSVSGEEVWSARYTAFGEAQIRIARVSNPLRFPGQYYDGETGLHHNYFRDYDPVVGRYLQSDPMGLDGGLNTHAYAHQDPLNQIDPNGLFAPAVYYGAVAIGNVGRAAWSTYRAYKTAQAVAKLAQLAESAEEAARDAEDDAREDGCSPPVPGARLGRPTRGDSTNWEVDGRDPNDDFENLWEGEEFTPMRGPKSGYRWKRLPDGRVVEMHPSSGGGAGNYKGLQTIGIPKPGGGVDKVRYLQ